MKKRLTLVALVAVACTSLFLCIKCSAGMKTVVVDDVEFSHDNIEVEATNYIKTNKPVFDNADLNRYVTYNVDVSDITNRGFFTRVADCFRKTSYSLGYNYTFDSDGIKSYLTEYNKTAKKSESAYIVEDKDNFIIAKEIYGTEVDTDKFLSDLKCDYSTITLSDYYIQPEVTESDLQQQLNELNAFVNWHCSYTNGGIIASDISRVHFEDGQVILDTEWISEVISETLKSYNTVGIEREFTTNSGEVVTVSKGTWGSSVDLETETVFLTTAFQNGISVDARVPEYACLREDIGNTYVEVSIDNQHVWVYKDGEMIMDSPCVTGDAHLKRNTPTGMYFMSECINGKYLRGTGYKTWVNKWMRLTNTGIGLHDATWRGSFGGSIYKTNGSHGCINLPKKFAYDLFDMAYVGMPVIVY